MNFSVRNILAPIDLSAAGGMVCTCALETARRFTASVTVLFVVEELEEFRGLNLPSVSYDELLPDLEAQARERLDRFLAPFRKDFGPIQARVTHGEAYEKILALAVELPADLIVMGTHGRKGLERAIFGSTAERVVRTARVPVLTVPVKE